jgi:arylformamidase
MPVWGIGWQVQCKDARKGSKMRKAILFGAMVALCASAGLAQRGKRLGRECRQEVMQLCGQGGQRGAIRACLIKEREKLSPDCKAKLVEMRQRRSGEGGMQKTSGGTEYAYSSDAKQKLDFWPAREAKAPLVIFIHGGGWSIGDKGNDRSDKAGFYTGKGYAYATLNYRLVPEAKPDGQAADIADAIAWLRRDAARLGFDPDQIILMGHSAGAHLAALVSSDPRYLAKAGVPMGAIRGTVLLDGAGYDVAAQMADKGNRVQRMYDAAFGADPAYQKQVSPITHAAAPNVSSWLLLHVASRADSGAQSAALGAALGKAGARATVTAVPDSSHMSVNRDAGVAGSFVAQQIEAFMKEAGVQARMR